MIIFCLINIYFNRVGNISFLYYNTNKYQLPGGRSFLVICQENFEKILMGFPVKRAHFTIICFAERKNKRQFDSLFGSASSCSPVYSWFLASNPKTSRTSLRDVSASALLC